ncbi:hypothetical protein PM082_006242 [Marasmius tenuissimus]|nr:hypothetical protein PM082_006242 [Marasmius tenuissimus]
MGFRIGSLEPLLISGTERRLTTLSPSGPLQRCTQQVRYHRSNSIGTIIVPRRMLFLFRLNLSRSPRNQPLRVQSEDSYALECAREISGLTPEL